MKWIIGKIVGNPMVLMWAIAGAFIAGVSSGGYAAWTIQGGRLTASKLEFSQYKLDQAEQENKDIIAAKAESKLLSNQLAEAKNAATKREQTIRSLSASLADAHQQLQNTTGQIARSLSGYTAEASRIAAATFAELFTDCQGKYAALAETADRHASDVETLIDAWPVIRGP